MEENKTKKGLPAWAIVIIIIASLAVVTGVIVGGVMLLSGNDNDNIDINIPPVSYEGFKEYKNEELGFSFSYPESFELVKEDIKDSYSMISFMDNTTGASTNIVVNNVNQNLSHSAYIEASKKSILNTFSTLKENDITVTGNLKMGGAEASTLKYDLNGVTVYQIATMRNKHEYVITFGEVTTDFDKELGDKIFSTFRFTK